MKVAVCIQARLGSTRLPEKVLRSLAGKPLLLRIADQIKALSVPHEIVVATSDSAQDDRLESFAKDHRMKVYRGPVDDIISRLYGALKLTDADVLVRVWGDCPFICPDVIEEMLQKMQAGGYQFVNNSAVEGRTYPAGLDLEIYHRSLLEQMNQDVVDLKQREFPVEYVKSVASKIKTFKLNTDIAFPDLNLTVDYPEDLEAAARLYIELEKHGLPFDYKTLSELLRKTNIANQFAKGARNIEYKEYLNKAKGPIQ